MAVGEAGDVEVGFQRNTGGSVSAVTTRSRRPNNSSSDSAAAVRDGARRIVTTMANSVIAPSEPPRAAHRSQSGAPLTAYGSASIQAAVTASAIAQPTTK